MSNASEDVNTRNLAEDSSGTTNVDDKDAKLPAENNIGNDEVASTSDVNTLEEGSEKSSKDTFFAMFGFRPKGRNLGPRGGDPKPDPKAIKAGGGSNNGSKDPKDPKGPKGPKVLK